MNDSYHTQTQIDTHTSMAACLASHERMAGGRRCGKSEKKERSRCRVFRRAKQRDTVDMNCCYYRPVRSNTKDGAAAVDVKEIQTERERECDEEERKFMLQEKRKDIIYFKHKLSLSKLIQVTIGFFIRLYVNTSAQETEKV